MGVPGGHDIDDEHQQDQTAAKEHEAGRAGDAFPMVPFVADAVLVEADFGNEAVIPALEFMEHFGFHATIPDQAIRHNKSTCPERTEIGMAGGPEMGKGRS